MILFVVVFKKSILWFDCNGSESQFVRWAAKKNMINTVNKNVCFGFSVKVKLQFNISQGKR